MAGLTACSAAALLPFLSLAVAASFGVCGLPDTSCAALFEPKRIARSVNPKKIVFLINALHTILNFSRVRNLDLLQLIKQRLVTYLQGLGGFLSVSVSPR